MEESGNLKKQILSERIYNEYLSGAKDIGFMSIQYPTTEEELLKKNNITPEEILKLRTYTETFLCPESANIYGIEITRFTIREMKTGAILLDLRSTTGDEDALCKEYPDKENSEISINELTEPSLEDAVADRNGTRSIVRYDFPPDFLTKSPLGATVEFKIGNQEIKKFRMIEMHFFKDKLLKIFDFTFGFCIPNSVNTWDHIYEIPNLSSEMIKEMTSCPYETRSETFYFVNEKLVIHNKAEYSYSSITDDWD